MAKGLTQWSNDAATIPQVFTPVSKNTAMWTQKDTRTPQHYTVATKNTSQWAKEHPSQTYFYNDANMTYNSAYDYYDYLVNTNTDNQRLVTKWSGA